MERLNNNNTLIDLFNIIKNKSVEKLTFGLSSYKSLKKLYDKILHSQIKQNDIFNFFVSELQFMKFAVEYQREMNEVKYSHIIDRDYKNNGVLFPKDDYFFINCSCGAKYDLFSDYSIIKNELKCQKCGNILENEIQIDENFKNHICKGDISLPNKYILSPYGIKIKYNKKFVNFGYDCNQYREEELEKIDDNIGEGMCGNVQKKITKNGNEVVVKKIKINYFDIKSLSQIERELIILLENKLIYQSPYIVELKYAYENKGEAVFVMENMDEGNLSDVIINYWEDNFYKLNPTEKEHILFSIIYQISQGVLDLNTNERTLHYDIKPENILVDKYGRVKLSDFNVSKLYNNKNQQKIFKESDINEENNVNIKDNLSNGFNAPKDEILEKNNSLFFQYEKPFEQIKEVFYEENRGVLNNENEFIYVDNNSFLNELGDFLNFYRDFSENKMDLGRQNSLKFIKTILKIVIGKNNRELAKKSFNRVFEKLSAKYEEPLINSNSLIYLENEKKYKEYYKYDVWSIGAILFYLICGEGIFKNSNFYSQIQFNSERLYQSIQREYNFSNELISFLNGCLQIDRKKRFSILDVLHSEWFKKWKRPDENWLFKIGGGVKNFDINENFRVRRIEKINENPEYNSINKNKFIFNGNENEISLCFNNIGNIGFQKLCGKKPDIYFDRLISVDLSSNNISDISCLSIEFFHNLKILNLSLNKIEDITIFSKLERKNKLEHLFLNYNKIKDLSSLNDIYFENLVYLDFSNNLLDNIKFFEKCKLDNLEFLGLSNNNIEDIYWILNDNFPKKKLKFLLLNGNEIKTIEMIYFVYFPELEVFDLSNNQIDKIDYFSKSKFNKLRLLNLSGNKIKDITPIKDIKIQYSSKIEVLLDDNPINRNLSKLRKEIETNWGTLKDEELIEKFSDAVL